ncbi:pyridoxamine 5'-phosphate oxidase [alpha proteobacterium IMCC14465]|uniref:Pyridoxine/pyridoxamine 5'-phosphate oxidase n=1 Tax=alpha proteobacterium IMCC14465 TaxID=1220535 RepID=J9A6U1_9PROT|nr:pyridoxamine 5'-phosphate oxidase [alpha proteobacterium IMCC14465]
MDFQSPPDNPLTAFAAWLSEAEKTEPNDPNAMSVATVDTQGMPNVRVVLLKGVSDEGFVFYTNLESAKGQELGMTAKAALCFHWKSLHRQVRVRGDVEQVSDAEADAYYASRARGSQIGAWASQQSTPLSDRETLEARVAEFEEKFANQDVPRPSHWSGWLIKPQEIEFWQDGDFRLHDRIVYRRPDDVSGWQTVRLFP